MSLLTLIKVPDKKLRKISVEVDKVDKNIQRIMDDMLETMYHENGIGLAAPQVAIHKRIVVMDIATDSIDDEGNEDGNDCKNNELDRNVIYMVNPSVTIIGEEKSTYEEGCLSVPGHKGDVERPSECTVDYLDYNGKEQSIHCKGLLATCVQHEIDHLDGKLFIDYLSRLKRTTIIRKLTKESANK